MVAGFGILTFVLNVVMWIVLGIMFTTQCDKINRNNTEDQLKVFEAWKETFKYATLGM